MSDYKCIYMVAMNVPPDTDAKGMAEFNDFYSNVHVPEVVSKNAGFLNGTRYELLNPAPNQPRFLAMYEVATEADGLAHLNRAANPAPGPSQYSTGPEVWQKHDTLWRLMYRRIEQ